MVTYFSYNSGYSPGTGEVASGEINFARVKDSADGRDGIFASSARMPAVVVITNHFHGTLPRRQNGVEGTTKGQRATIEAEINRRWPWRRRGNSRILHASGARLSQVIVYIYIYNRKNIYITLPYCNELIDVREANLYW